MKQKKKVSGVILVDKPQAMTSQQVVSKVKYLFMSAEFNSKKAGHTGTLDPMATGLLPICLGEATKFSHYQLDANKSYRAIIKLGEQTDTGDAEGQIIATKNIPIISEEMLADICKQFLGDIEQIPPMYSALKKDGKKLYEYARAGQEVERPPRPICISDISLELVAKDQLALTVSCSKGTYVRVLGEDIAQSLGTLGHLTALQRTAVGGFSVDNAIGLEHLEQLDFTSRFKCLMGVDVFLLDLPKITLDNQQIVRIGNGQRLNVRDQVQADWFTLADKIDIRLYNDMGDFVALGSLESNGRLQPTKVLNL